MTNVSVMTESFRRRSVLGAICGIAIGVGAGCVNRTPTGQSTTSTPTHTTGQQNQEKNCQPVPNSDGAPKPWFDPDSPVDIQISNGIQSDVEVTLTIDNDQRDISIPAEDYWLSEDIIDDGQHPIITVATQNFKARLKWKGEQNNMGIAVFVIRKNRIDASFTHKFCSKFTS